MGKVNIETIKKQMFDEMSEKVGTSDLYWVECLFDYGLKEDLKIESGEIELERYKQHFLEDKLKERGVYGHYDYYPKAQIFSEKIPEDYLLFVLGPKKYKKDSLRVLCIPPILTGRDREEMGVLVELDGRVSKEMKGKHPAVRGKLILPRIEDWGSYSRVMEKSFGPIVQQSAEFSKDIGDLVICAGIYQRFEIYQRQRDEIARDKAEEIINAVSKI